MKKYKNQGKPKQIIWRGGSKNIVRKKFEEEKTGDKELYKIINTLIEFLSNQITVLNSGTLFLCLFFHLPMTWTLKELLIHFTHHVYLIPRSKLKVVHTQWQDVEVLWPRQLLLGR